MKIAKSAASTDVSIFKSCLQRMIKAVSTAINIKGNVSDRLAMEDLQGSIYAFK